MGVAKAPVCNLPLLDTSCPCAVPIIRLPGTTLQNLRLDSNKKYPRDLHGEVHDDGEIWSACLWELRTALGGPAADKLIIAHHFLLTPNSTFEDAARRGILPNPKRKNRRAGFRFDDIRAEAAKRRPRRTVARSRGR